MIVTCPECDTSFQLDESRVPHKGIRVRCSRCKHAFHLAHPSASRSQVIDALASDAAASGGTSTPSATQDLTSPRAPVARPDTSGSASFGGDEINNEDDAEWEFNQDVPTSDAPAPAPPSAAAPPVASAGAPAVEEGASDFGGSIDEAESRLDLATDDDHSGLELDTGNGRPSGAPPPAAPASDESSSRTDFGSVDDFSSLMEDDDSQATDDPLDDRGDGDSLREQAAEQAGRYAGAGRSDELGDPESWDFFDDDTPTAPSPPRSPSPQGVALGRMGVVPAARTARAATIGPADDFDESGWAGQSRLAHVLEAAGRMVGWTIVIVAFSLGLASGLWTTAESFVAGERTAALGSVEAVDMRAQWVDTARAGRLLLVSGGLRNVTRRSVTVEGPIEIALLDRLGQALGVAPTALGVELAERQIRELPIEVLARMRAHAAQRLLGTSIPPGGQLPFQAVIFEPPPEGLRFAIRQAEGGRLSLPMPSVGSASSQAPPEAVGAMDGSSGALEPAPSASDEMHETDETGETSEPVEATTGAAPTAPDDAPSAPGYDGAYGDDAGLGLQDL